MLHRQNPLEYVVGVTRKMVETRDLDALLPYVMQTVLEFVGSQHGYIILVDEHGNSNTLIDHTGRAREDKNAVDFISHSILKFVVESGEHLVLSNAMTDPRFFDARSVLHHRIRSVMCVPLIAQERVLGAIYVENRSIKASFKEVDVDPMILFANQAAMSIENARLYGELEQRVSQRTQALEVANKELAVSQSLAQAANKAKSAFLANMSHELRTPLNSIIGFAELMYKRPQFPIEEKEYLKIITQSGEHLLQLINDILEISKIEAGHNQNNVTDFNLAQLVDEVQEMMWVPAERKGLRILTSLSDDTPRHICADKTKLQQILINLLGNALKFTDEGQIEIRIKRSENQPALQTEQDHSAVMLRFEVEDTGYGIAENEMGKLFQLFSQTESGIKSRKGTGLGLAITANHVQMMGGEVSVHSELGVGSMFAFDIVVSLSDQTGIQISSPVGYHIVQVDEQYAGLRHLIVDNNKANRILLRNMLQDSGFDQIQEAESGGSALTQFESFQPDLVWMDIHMGDMDGREATRLIRLLPKGKEAVIVAVTAGVFDEMAEFHLVNGFNDIVYKPFRATEILDKMVQHIGVLFSSDPVDREERSQLDSTFVLEEAHLSELNADWKWQFCDAAKAGDFEQCHRLLNRLEGVDAEVVHALRHLIDTFRFDQLVALLQG